MPVRRIGSLPGPAERERDAVGLLDRWPADLRGVLVGGYAVSAYGPPRYSVDLDFVIRAEKQVPAEDWLKQERFGLGKRWKSRAEGSTAAVSRWQKGLITIDLLAGAVRDREAGVDVPASWVMKVPRMVRLVLLSSSTSSPFPVCRPAALWALKLQAGRPQDLSDLFVISEVPVPLEEVRALFESLWCASLRSKLERVQRALGEEHTFRDACSRRSLGPPDSARNRRAWQTFQRRVASAIPDGEE
jgi:hypothetical protein